MTLGVKQKTQLHCPVTLDQVQRSGGFGSKAISPQKIFRIALLICSILAGLLIVEVTLRIVDRPAPVSSGWRSLADKSELNQLYFRGQPIEYTKDDFVIVLLGDSSVEATACGYEWMPERRLQFYLNSNGKRVKVVTLGTSGYGQDQELLALQEYLGKYRADMVLLWFALPNDVWNNLFPTHFPTDGTPKPTYWLDQKGQLRGPSEGWGQLIRETPRLKLTLLWRNLRGWSRDRAWETGYPPAYVPMTQTNDPVKDDWQRRWDNNTRSMRDENLGTEKSHFAVFLTPRSQRTQYGLDLTRKLLEEINHLTQSHGGQFAMFTNDSPREETDVLEGTHVLKGKYYKTSMAQYLSNLDYVSQGFKFYSLPITEAQWKVGPDNTHLNEHAMDQFMKGLAGRVEIMVPAQK